MQIFEEKPFEIKLFISETNKMKRLEFEKTHVKKPLEIWKNVIFSMKENSIFLAQMVRKLYDESQILLLKMKI